MARGRGAMALLIVSEIIGFQKFKALFALLECNFNFNLKL